MKLEDNLAKACELVAKYYKYKECCQRDECGTGSCPQYKCHNFARLIDAWRPIWDTMWHKDGIPLDKQKVSFVRYATELANCCGAVIGKLPDDDDGLNLGNIIQMDSAYFIATATELHHLEAALRAAEVECDRCFVTCEYAIRTNKKACKGNSCALARDNECDFDGEIRIDCTCTNGRISLYQQLEREVGG